jgi:hypothetical protein
MAAEQYNGSRNGAPDVEFCEVTREQLLARVDRGAKRRLGLSGWEEFAKKYHSGSLPDTLAVNELSILLDTAEQSRV